MFTRANKLLRRLELVEANQHVALDLKGIVVEVLCEREVAGCVFGTSNTLGACALRCEDMAHITPTLSRGGTRRSPPKQSPLIPMRLLHGTARGSDEQEAF